ncbi:MAG: 4-hydroxy-3-methylbut-2-enyl diphosphate reductase [Fervidicoccus fontis]|nr:MAG: 4-hydroxy-3-methylbut-2-enyl diphosphate reductase [Fervidicoccus fontis]HEM55905.1 4-hydroxy-3-methylbut-2-enyl diphosphate reductase [Thermodesulfobium narugense]
MTIKRASSLGFCYGVRLAHQKVLDALKKYQRVNTLGPLIHNEREVDRLSQLGVTIINSLDEVNAPVVVLRTHGVRRDTLERARKLGIEVIDATCPHVAKAQSIAHKFYNEGYHIVILGEIEHPEVQSILSYAPDATVVNENLEKFSFDKRVVERVGLLSQTTQPIEKLKLIASRMVELSQELVVANTVCFATRKRQEAAKELAGEVEAMIVIGGKASSNTKKLFLALSSYNIDVYQVEGVADLPESVSRYKRIGITAGASTPEWIIEEVESRLKSL